MPTKDYIKANWKGLLPSFIFSVLAFVIFFATWGLYFKIVSNSSIAILVFLALFACVPLFMFAANVLFAKNKKLNIATLVIAVFAILEHVLFLAYVLSKLFYIVYEAAPYLAIILGALVLAALIFLPRFKRQKPVRITLICVLSAVYVCVAMFGLFNLAPLYFDSGAAVFAVEDEYQIAFSTSKNTVGCVRIGDKVFYDSVGGSKRTSTVHKISVPRELLDDEKSYTVSCRSVIRDRAYLTSSGGEIEKTYSFRPVDCEDGIQIFNFSDNHLLRSGVERASRYYGDKLDLIIANGDLFNDVSDEFQVTLVYKLLGSASGGRVPIIMTRGNHECVGSKLASLPDYMPSYGDNFYYTVRFGGVLFYVLDLANDMSDNSMTIRPTANFDSYRAAEVEWLKAQPSLEERAGDGVERIVALCHMPYAECEGKSYEKYAAQFASEAERIGVQLLISGHRHKTLVIEAGELSYPCIIGGKRSDSLDVDETIFASAFTGTAIDIEADGIYMSFVNSKCEALLSRKIV